MMTYSTSFKHVQDRQTSTTLAAASPFTWLQEGWNDFINAPMISVLIGTGFTLLCIIAYTAAAAQPVLSGTVLSLLLMPVAFPLPAYATWHSYRELSESSMR